MKANRNIARIIPYRDGFIFRKLNSSGVCRKSEKYNLWICDFYRASKYNSKSFESLKKDFDEIVIKCGIVWTHKQMVLTEEALILLSEGFANYKMRTETITFTHK